MSFFYLASPYSHESVQVKQSRYETAMSVTARLLTRDWIIYSPIVHCHELAKAHSLPGDFAFWQRYNNAMLDSAVGLIVLCLAGWRESKGVQAEISYILAQHKPIIYIDERIQLVKGDKYHASKLAP